MNKTIVLGAGIAGLAAALELAEKGTQVEILESSPTIGGLAKNSHYKGFTFDMGPHRIYSEFPDTMRFISELCDNQLLNVPRKSRMRMAGRFYEYPPQAKELLFHLPPGLMMKFIASYMKTKITPSKKLPSESNYEGYLVRRFGKAMCNFFFLPYAKKVWGIPPSEISADIAKLRLSQKNLTNTIKEIVKGPPPDQPKTALPEFQYPKKGVGVIADALAERVKKLGVVIHCGVKITEFKIQRDLYGTIIREIVCDSTEGTVTFPCDNVISTIPLSALIPLTRPTDENLPMVTRSLRHRGIILCCLLLRRPHLTDDHWLYFPGEEFHFTRIHQPKNFSSDLCPQNKTSIVAELTCFHDDHRWNSTDVEIYDYLLGDFLTTQLLNETDIEDYYIVRIRNGYPIYDFNYQNKLNQIFQYLRSIQNLISTGRQGLFHHNNIDHSIIMGQEAARAFLNSSEPVKHWYDNLRQFDRFRVVD